MLEVGCGLRTLEQISFQVEKKHDNKTETLNAIEQISPSDSTSYVPLRERAGVKLPGKHLTLDWVEYDTPWPHTHAAVIE